MSYNDSFPLSNVTKKMLRYLPSWMTMRTNENSLGTQFINSPGLEFEQVEEYILDMINSQYLDTADISKIDYVWKTDLYPILLDGWKKLSFRAKYKDNDTNIYEPFDVKEVTSYEDFYLGNTDFCMVDYDTGICYIRRPSDCSIEFEYLHVDAYDGEDDDGGLYISEFAIHHIWNSFDEIGLLLGTPRLFKEDNQRYRDRLKNVFLLRGGPTLVGLKNGITGLLGTSDVEIKELCDIAFRDSLLNEDGSASDKLKKYARIINDQIANTWDNMSWDKAYWRSLEHTKLGFDYLPHVWNASTEGWVDEDFQSGVGCGLDLYVNSPKNESSEQEFEYYVQAQAAIDSSEVRYPEHTFSYRILAKGTKIENTPNVEEFKYTIVAAENIDLQDNIVINGKREYNQWPIISWDTVESMSTTLEVVNSNKIMSPSVDGITPRPYLKVIVTMENDTNDTPLLNSITVGWKDTSDIEHTTTLNSGLLFERTDDLSNDSGPFPLIHITKENTEVVNNHVELSYGDFQQIIDNDSDWRNGEMNNCVVSGNSLKLNVGVI